VSARIVSTHVDLFGTPFFAGGSPYVYGARKAWLFEALRRDVSLMQVERAAHKFREIPKDEPYPHPENCTPYRDASGCGLSLKPRLPLLFVKTRHGELLQTSRAALAYARENAAEFGTELKAITHYAAEILDASVVRRYVDRAPLLFSDIVQPYDTFGHGFFSLPAGFYVVSDPGIGTMIGPPINRSVRISVQSGLIETDWHHSSLFVVIAQPTFEGRSLLLLPKEELAQLYFVAYRQAAEATIEYSMSDTGAEPEYGLHWRSVAKRLHAEGKGVPATKHGLATVTPECLHCRISVTRAAEEPLPDGHVTTSSVIGTYRDIQQHRRSKARE
jgi:hypothetical protein